MTITWQFGEPGSETVDAPATEPVTYTYSTPGTYLAAASHDQEGTDVIGTAPVEAFGFANAGQNFAGTYTMGTYWLGLESTAKFVVSDVPPTATVDEAWLATHGLANPQVWPTCTALKIVTYSDPIEVPRAAFVSGSVADVLGIYLPTAAGVVYWTVHVLTALGGTELATYPLTFTVANGTTATAFDPGEYTIAQVLDYLDAHPDELDAITAAEEAGKARVTLLSELEARKGE